MNKLPQSDIGLQFVASKPKRRWRRFSLGLLCLVLFLAVVFSRFAHIRQLWDEQCCRKELEVFAQELMSFTIPNKGHLPYAYIVDGSGKRMHSWRSCLIPFVDRREYSGSGHKYRFDEPWDSPANTWFRNATEFCEYYSCPVYAAGSRNASYLCPLGGVLWPVPNAGDRHWNDRSPSRSFQEGGVLPSHGKAILLVEVVKSSIPWTEPEDIAFSEIASLLQKDPSGEQFRRRIRNVVVVDAKKAIEILNPELNLEEIKAIVDMENKRVESRSDAIPGARTGARVPLSSGFRLRSG